MTLLPFHNLKSLEPAANIENAEFNEISLKFGAFISMTQNKCLNHVSTLAIIMKNPQYREAYMLLVGTNNIYDIVQSFIQNTPNLYKKVAKKSLFQ